MSKFIKIFILLMIVGAGGYYIGTQKQEVSVVVKETDVRGGVVQEAMTFILSRSELQAISGDVGIKSSSIPWYVSRASGITAYMLMFFAVLWGAGMTMGFTYRITNPVRAWTLHKYMTIGMTAAVFLHAFSLLLDEFINFGWVDILVPFASDYKPIYLSVGITAFYILLLVMATSLLLRIRAPRFWRTTHYLTYLLFIFSLVHGLFMGTDSGTFAMQVVYWVTGGIFGILVLYRFVLSAFKNFFHTGLRHKRSI